MAINLSLIMNGSTAYNNGSISSATSGTVNVTFDGSYGDNYISYFKLSYVIYSGNSEISSDTISIYSGFSQVPLSDYGGYHYFRDDKAIYRNSFICHNGGSDHGDDWRGQLPLYNLLFLFGVCHLSRIKNDASISHKI